MISLCCVLHLVSLVYGRKRIKRFDTIFSIVSCLDICCMQISLHVPPLSQKLATVVFRSLPFGFRTHFCTTPFLDVISSFASLPSSGSRPLCTSFQHYIWFVLVLFRILTEFDQHTSSSSALHPTHPSLLGASCSQHVLVCRSFHTVYLQFPQTPSFKRVYSLLYGRKKKNANIILSRRIYCMLKGWIWSDELSVTVVWTLIFCGHYLSRTESVTIARCV